MRPFRIGRVFGIDVRVDWSWVFIFVLMTWNLVAVFSQWHPHWSLPAALAIATTASLAFFGCVLLHEMAHSLVAMGYGLRVRSITLFLFGGVSNIEHELPSPQAEFLTAIVGPLTSIALGIGFLMLAAVVTPVPMTDAKGALTAVAQLGPLSTLLAWLGPINIMIGLFNLIPGFPLDGGRVFRSIVWKITGDLATATRWAAAVGQAIGWMFIAAGFAMSFGAHIPLVGTGVASGLWLAFIGWFLRSAATQATSRLALDETLDGITVEQLMARRVPAVEPDLSVSALVNDRIVPGEDRALPVVHDGVLLGLVSITDVRKVHPTLWAGSTVGSIMRGINELSTARPDQPLIEAFEQLAEQNVSQLPVVVNGKFVGMLRRRDVTRWLDLAWQTAAERPGHVATAHTRDGVQRVPGERHPA